MVQASERDYFKENDVSALRAIAMQLATMFESVKLLKEARQGGAVLESIQRVEARYSAGSSASKGWQGDFLCIGFGAEEHALQMQPASLGADWQLLMRRCSGRLNRFRPYS